MSETLNNPTGEQVFNSDGPWGEAYQNSVPPFSPDQTPKSESEEYSVVYDDIEQRNLDDIDISTEQGKYEYLDSLIGNAEQWYEENPQEASDDRAVVARQRKILQNLDVSSDGQTVEKALEQRIANFAEVMNNPNASDEAQKTAYENWYAAQNLNSVLTSETKRRNPENSKETRAENPDTQETEDDAKKEQESSPENLREKFDETKELVSEIKKVDGLFEDGDLDELCSSFGFDLLSKKFGVEQIVEVSRKEFSECMDERDRAKFANKFRSADRYAYSELYDRILHSLKPYHSRYALESDRDGITVFEDYGRGGLKFNKLGGNVGSTDGDKYSATFGRMNYIDGTYTDQAMLRTGKNGDLNHQIFVSGLNYLDVLLKTIENPDSKLFDDNHRTISSFVEGIEKPGMRDFFKGIQAHIASKAGDATKSLTDIQSTVESEADAFKKETMDDLTAKINELQKTKKALAVEGSKLDDPEESRIIVEAVTKLDALERAKKVAAFESIATERQRLYGNLGEGSEKYILQAILDMKERTK